MTLDKLEYDGFGVFVIRDASWAKTETPHVPMTLMAQTLHLDRLTERQMQSMGYMRIPSELTEPG